MNDIFRFIVLNSGVLSGDDALKSALLNDVFRFAERDVSSASDAPFGRDVCLRHVSGTHHITATTGSNITVPQA